MFDYLVVGSDLYGVVFAHEAKAHGKSVLVMDKRPNIAIFIPRIKNNAKRSPASRRTLRNRPFLLLGVISAKLTKGYKEKQWGRDCKDLSAFIIKRLPVRCELLFKVFCVF